MLTCVGRYGWSIIVALQRNFRRNSTLAKLRVLIISPALAKANNGNWQTAARWSQFLRSAYRVNCIASTDAVSHADQPDVVIALHARRSAAALREFYDTTPTIPRILVLTGTDLYRDIHCDDEAKHSLQIASHLVVLQPAGLAELPPSLIEKTSVIFQSAKTLVPFQRPSARRKYFNATMIGHLRAEKDPLTFLRACTLLRHAPIQFTHIGNALEVSMAEQVAATTAVTPHYHWLGNQSHAVTRQRLKRSDVMVITSVMEGGANVIIEAVTSGVPVIASDIAGNRGMLGNDYLGYFPVGDATALAVLIQRAATEELFLAELRRQCDRRRVLFSPEHERASVLLMVDNCVRHFALTSD